MSDERQAPIGWPFLPRFLLLQARVPGDPMAAHEHRCFAASLGVPVTALACHSLLDGPPSEALIDETDLILIGGSGDFSVCGDEPFLRGFFDFLSDVCVARDIPTFGSCFGFQGLVVAGGGTVIRDPERTEVGTFEVFLTEVGRKDPLLGALSPSFKAQLGHTDRAVELPAGVQGLAYSERVSQQAFRIPGRRIFATQFHPELNRSTNEDRYRRYRERYGGATNEAEDPVLQSLADSPGATALLERWVREVIADGA